MGTMQEDSYEHPCLRYWRRLNSVCLKAFLGRSNAYSNYSAGGSQGPARPLSGVRGVPVLSPPPPKAVREGKDLNSYCIYQMEAMEK